MNDSELLELNHKGFIPGPKETEAHFEARVAAAQNFNRIPPAPFNEMEKVAASHWEWVFNHLEALYDFRPDCVTAFYSNRKLTPWQGAVSWIMSDSSGPLCAIQLRKGFKKGKYLKIYSREEVLSHEAVHAARCAFEEPSGEEFFAYLTSSSKWRQIFGPLFQKSWEAGIFLLATLVGSIFKTVAPPAILIGLSLFRLFRNRYRIKKASERLFLAVKSWKKVRAILFRLTDAEILQLSKGIWVDGDNSIRWRLIKLAYLEHKI